MPTPEKPDFSIQEAFLYQDIEGIFAKFAGRVIIDHEMSSPESLEHEATMVILEGKARMRGTDSLVRIQSIVEDSGEDKFTSSLIFITEKNFFLSKKGIECWDAPSPFVDEDRIYRIRKNLERVKWNRPQSSGGLLDEDKKTADG